MAESKQLWTIPNIVTLLRIMVIPLFVLVAFLPFYWAHALSAMLFALAALTDWLDGFLARKLKQVTRLGAFLDPVADKLIVVVALVLLVHKFESLGLTLSVMIIIMREVLISALREWMAEMGRRTSVAVSYIGKMKTTAQMASVIVLLLVDPAVNIILARIGLALLYLAAFLTIWSMMIYLKAAWPDLNNEGSSYKN